MTLIVLTAASDRNLTTLAAVKARLGIDSLDEDPFLQAEIARQSAVVQEHLGIVFAQDGTRTMARETLQETFRATRPQRFLRTARRPVSAVASVVENEITLDPAAYEFDARAGVLSRLYEGWPSAWCGRSIVVTYTAGWVLPGAAGANLPSEIETAVIEMVKAAREARFRDPMVRSESSAQVGSVSYLDPRAGMEAMPPQAAALLAPYMDGPRL